MKKILGILILFCIIISTYKSVSAQGIGTIPQLQQFVSTTSPVSGITQQVYGKSLIITGLTPGSNLCLDANNRVTTTGCTTGGGGSGSGTWATTTSTHAGRLINYPLNTTDIITIGGNSTTTGATEVWFDPNTENYKIGSSNTASTTLMGIFNLPTLSQGFSYIGSGGKLNTIASSSIRLSWFNNDAGFLTSYTSPFEIATTGSISISQLSYFNKTSGRTTIGGVSTTSVTCSGTVSCTSFTAIGASPITITGAGGTSASSTLLSDFNTWTGRNNFKYASTSNLTVSENASTTNLTVSELGNPFYNTGADKFLTVDNAGKLVLHQNDIQISEAYSFRMGEMGFESGGDGSNILRIDNQNPSHTMTVALDTSLVTPSTVPLVQFYDGSGVLCLFDVNCVASTTSNIWSGLQTFNNSSTTRASFNYASSTSWFGGGLTSCSNGTTDKLLYNSSTGTFSCGTDQTGGGSAAPAFTPTAYGASTSTTLGLLAGFFSTASSTLSGNTFFPALSQGIAYIGSNGKLGATATSSFSLSQFTNDLANLTAGDSSLTFSGSYNGSAARNIVLNMGNANTWTALQTFGNSTTTYGSFTNASTTNLFLGTGQGALYTGSGARVAVVATSTPTVTAPITYSGTLGSFLGGVAGTFGCTTASSGVTGCLSGTDWNTFNGKESVLTFNYPLSRSANTISYNGLGTTTTWSAGQVPYIVNGNTLIGLSTSTPTIGSSLSYTGTMGNVLGGSSGTLSLNLGNANTWTALQTFGNSSTTLGSFSYASSTLWQGGGLQTCDPTTGKLTWSAGQFGCGTDQSGGGSFSGAANSIIVSNSAGNGIVATSSFPLYVGSILATTTTATSTFNGGVVANYLSLKSATGFEALFNHTNTANRSYTIPDVSGSLVSWGDNQLRNNIQRLGHNFINILSNASFEYWYGGTSVAPTAWTTQSSGGTFAIAQSSTASTGSYSAQVSFDNTDDQLRFEFPAYANTRFTFTIFYQRLSGAGTAVNLVAQENGADFTEYASQALDSTVDGTWRFAMVTFTKPNDGTNSVRFKLSSQDANNSVWLFDESMAQEGLNVATAFTNNLIDDASVQNIYAVKTFYSGANFATNDTTSSGRVGFATTTPSYLMTAYSASAPQLSLSAGAGLAQWAFRNAGGNFYLSTTTVAGTATTSTSALSILTSSGNVGIGTSTPGSLFAIDGVANFVKNAISTVYNGLAVLVKLVIPVGTAPTMDQAGSLALDTTSNNLILATSTSGHIVVASATTTLYSFTASTTAIVSGTNIDLPSHPLQQVATSIWCKVSSGTSLVVNLSDGTNDTNTVTCTTTGAQYALTSNNTFTSYEAIRTEYGAKTGDVGYLSLRVMGYRISD